MGTIIFARHAESQANAAGLINADPRVRNPLSHRGIEQARRLSEALRNVPIDVCFTSQLLRAKQTAEIVMTGRGVDVIELPELNEPAAGDFEGGPVETYNDWIVTRGYWAPNPGGETQVDALRRFMRAYWTILNHPSDWILIMAHALPIGWLREGIRASLDGKTDLGINFKDPGVELATPYSFVDQQVVDALGAFTTWLDQHSACTSQFGDDF